MDLVTLDFESFYSNDYTLSKLTTEEYIRDPRFETIMCGFKINDQKSYWVDAPDVQRELDRLNIGSNAVLCHHAHFDGLILSHHYNTRPKLWFDTLSMARAALGQKVPMSLAKLAERYGVGKKGTEVEDAKGKRRRDFSGSQIQRYGGYCCTDIDLTYDIFQKLLPAFQKSELKIIDMVIRMFTEPVLRLDVMLLEEYVQDIQVDKTGALLKAGIQLADVMSNDKFAMALEALGVMPPTKISPTTGKETWAFAKTDKGMEALAEHPDEAVQALVAARLKNKTTLAESRGIRMAQMGIRGPAPIYLKYSGAEQTHRLSGGDKMNWQNMGRGSKLRDSVCAPDGQTIVVGDSSNIEARVLTWLACQQDAVAIFDRADKKLGPDVYCIMAERIYNRPINKKDHPAERQLGKTAVLGLGYGMGGPKFVQAVRVMAKQIIDEVTAQMVVNVYRSTHPKVVELWKRAELALGHIAKGNEGVPVDERGVVRTTKMGLMLPNGLEIKYPDLQFKEGRGVDAGWSYWDGRARTKIYGGKVVENCLAAGTLVATSNGWKPIEEVLDSDMVYDGVDFVPHGGVVFKSVQPCRPIDGVWMTDDHEVLTDEGWKPALEKPEPRRADVWRTDRVTPSGVKWEEDEMGVLLPVWEDRVQSGGGRDQGAEARRHAELRMPEQAANLNEEPQARNESAPSLRSVEEHARPMPAADAQGVPKLWGTRHRCLRGVGGVPGVLGGHGADVPLGADTGAEGQQRRVFQSELRMGDSQSASDEPADHAGCGRSDAVEADGHSSDDAVLPAQARAVFDILNCGPRSRFVVRGERGMFIVHNCVQALARIVVLDQTCTLNEYLVVAHSVHDEAVAVTDEDDGPDATAFVEETMRLRPTWAPDLPLNSEGGHHQRYGKAK